MQEVHLRSKLPTNVQKPRAQAKKLKQIHVVHDKQSIMRMLFALVMHGGLGVITFPQRLDFEVVASLCTAATGTLVIDPVGAHQLFFASARVW